MIGCCEKLQSIYIARKAVSIPFLRATDISPIALLSDNNVLRGWQRDSGGIIAVEAVRCYEEMALHELQVEQEQQTIQNLCDTLRSNLRRLKMNTDGSSKGDLGDGGFGGLIRDERGIWLCGMWLFDSTCQEEGNMSANGLAKMGANQNEVLVVMDDPLEEIRDCYCNHHAFHVGFSIPSKPTTTTTTTPQDIDDQNQETLLDLELDDEVEPIDLWEEEDDAEPEIGDGGDGGGVVLQNCPWGERALSISHEILLQFELQPPIQKRLDEVGALGEIPDDLALEVSSPSAERLLKVPDDMNRFKDMPMRVRYVEDLESKCPEKNGVFYLDSIKTESGSYVRRLAGVKENRDPSAKGGPLSRKRIGD
ncbi:unnamed protein product [Camellia sinensis]